MEYFDLVLGYLTDHKIIAASIGVLFLYLLIKNFWLLVKLLIFLVLGALAFSLFLSFVGKATKGKKDLMEEPNESRQIEHMRPLMAESDDRGRYNRPRAMVSRFRHHVSHSLPN